MSALRISSRSNRVTVVAEDRADISVEGPARVEEAGSQTTVDKVRGRLEVRVPTGTDVVIGTTSARVEVKGRVGHVAVTSESGRVSVEAASSVDVRTRSGRVMVGAADGECRLRSTSGRVVVGRCGGADVATTSGRIVLRGVSGPVKAPLRERADRGGARRRSRCSCRDRVGADPCCPAARGQSRRDRLHVHDTVGERPDPGAAAMNSADVQTGSVLFTDLVGFTEFTDAVGDQAAVDLLDRQSSLAGLVLDQRDDGRIVKELGDGLMIWFDSADGGWPPRSISWRRSTAPGPTARSRWRYGWVCTMAKRSPGATISSARPSTSRPECRPSPAPVSC